jgi:Putative TOS1-like glycosyl hydrolase (DUF2401)
MAKREAEPESEHHDHRLNRHKRGHGHRHERRGLTTVTATTYTTSTQTNYGAQAPASGPCTTSTTTSAAAAAATGADWVRSSYFNAATGEADNIVFLNHMGGTAGSGTWDTCFGNTLSYAAANGVDGAASPQVFSSCTLPSDQEIILFTAQPCAGDCAYVREGTPAYKGFSTAEDVVFLVDFMMPRDSSSGFNVDMSAAWFLNAQIPRTLQYGSAACSCWTSGCGEFDVFEILSTGSDFLTTTLHSWQGTGTEYGGGGCSDYIERPLTSYMQAAIIFDAETSQFIITTLDTTGDFGSGLTDSQVETWAAPAGASTVNIA